jgi:hypothetical protein
MNTELLLRVKEKILNQPASLDMGIWKGAAFDVSLPLMLEPPCKTVACLAGWTCVLANSNVMGNFAYHAEQLLGITEEQSRSLFFTEKWPNKFSRAYRVEDNIINDIICDRDEDYQLTPEEIKTVKKALQRRAEVTGKLIEYAILHEGNLYQKYSGWVEFPDMQTLEV